MLDDIELMEMNSERQNGVLWCSHNSVFDTNIELYIKP